MHLSFIEFSYVLYSIFQHGYDFMVSETKYTLQFKMNEWSVENPQNRKSY